MIHTKRLYFAFAFFYKIDDVSIVSRVGERSFWLTLSFCSDGTEGSENDGRAAHVAFVDEVRGEWRMLWRDRIDDKTKAEGIANQDYSLLFVEGGTVIVATRDFKPLDFREILSLHEVVNVERFVSPHPSVGGWRKFSRTVLNRQSRARKWNEPAQRRKRNGNLQLKKGGRGWLHTSMRK